MTRQAHVWVAYSLHKHFKHRFALSGPLADIASPIQSQVCNLECTRRAKFAKSSELRPALAIPKHTYSETKHILQDTLLCLVLQGFMHCLPIEPIGVVPAVHWCSAQFACCACSAEPCHSHAKPVSRLTLIPRQRNTDSSSSDPFLDHWSISSVAALSCPRWMSVDTKTPEL